MTLRLKVGMHEHVQVKALVDVGDLNFELSQLYCLSGSVGRASCLECIRRGFESHLSAAFYLDKVVSALVLYCFVFLSECLSIHNVTFTMEG